MNYIIMARNIAWELLNEKKLLPTVISISTNRLVAKYVNGEFRVFRFFDYVKDNFTIYVTWLDSRYNIVSNIPTNQMEGFAKELNSSLNNRYDIKLNVEQIIHTYNAYEREMRSYYTSITMTLKQ